jgi:5-methylthioribose kinase
MQIKKINSINKKVSSRKIINEIDNYVRHSSRHQKINDKIGKLKKYIEVYDQNKICHGDLHLENIFIKKIGSYFWIGIILYFLLLDMI